MGFPGDAVVKNLPANAGDAGSIPGLGRAPGGGNANPVQYSCLENPTDRGAWGAARSQTRLTEHHHDPPELSFSPGLSCQLGCRGTELPPSTDINKPLWFSATETLGWGGIAASPSLF